MAIGTVEFDLSMTNPSTGELLTARTYTVEGVTNVDGSLRELSIGQLVMAICLQRAAELETSIITKMDEMETASAQLEAMTEIEKKVLDYFSNNTTNIMKTGEYTISDGLYAGTTYKTFLQSSAIGVLKKSDTQDQQYIYPDSKTLGSNADIHYSDFLTELESKMDDKNTFSQQTMIELQSLTNKRDQSYDMISNVLKSLNTVLVGIANNT